MQTELFQRSQSQNCLFEHINSLQCYELTRRCNHLLQTLPLTCAVHHWSVHCECAIKQNFQRKQRIFNLYYYYKYSVCASIIQITPCDFHIKFKMLSYLLYLQTISLEIKTKYCTIYTSFHFFFVNVQCFISEFYMV